MATFALDLTRRHFTLVRGEITVIGTWLRVDRQWRPCLALIPTIANGSVRPAIVQLDGCWVWSEEIGDPREAARQAYKIAKALNFEPEPRRLIRIGMMIASLLGDLMAIPPHTSDFVGKIIAELTVSERETGRTREVALREEA